MIEIIELAASILGALSAAGSAICWFRSARIKPSYPNAYLSGAPQDVVDNMDRQAKLNAMAAIFAGIAVLCQGVLLGTPLFSN